MQKYILKQKFKGFSVSNSEGLHKGYDRFQSLQRQVEIYDLMPRNRLVLTKQKSSAIAVTRQGILLEMTKPGVDILSFNDMYSNIRVFECDVKGFTASSSNTQNVPFVSENTSSTNDIDEFDLEEMDLKMAGTMISRIMKKFYKRTRSKGNQDSRMRDTWNTRNKDKENGRRSGKQEDSKALVTLDGEGVNWTNHLKDKQENYALMACSSPGSNTEMSARDKAGLGEETHESMPEPVVNKPKVVSKPKVWSDAPIIEEYESDSEDEHVSLPTKEQEIPSFAFINTDKHVKTPRQIVIEQNTCSQRPKTNKKDQ
ncbi:hypothetical protein Tco_1336961 [Tanacetum coccineum]